MADGKRPPTDMTQWTTATSGVAAFDLKQQDDSASRDDAAEAVAILEELSRTARRVLGTAHPITGGIQESRGTAQETLRRLAAFAPETE